MKTVQSNASKPTKRIDIELLALDLNACSRCVGTAANLRSAVSLVEELFGEVGIEVVYQEIVVGTVGQAERLRLESSPTVRINGRDIAIETRESQCGDCGELCGCGGGVNCRVWIWQGEEYVEAPKALFIDAILKAFATTGQPTETASIPFRLPENLKGFFAAREKNGTDKATCCDQQTCCEPSAKAACCGNGVESSKCGCR